MSKSEKQPRVKKLKVPKELKEKAPRKVMSQETRAKMSAKRRARTVQPRTGQTKKRQSFCDELAFDYAKDPKALEWIEANRHKMDGGTEQCKEWGVMNEYQMQYPNFYELKIGSVLFGKGLVDEEEISQEEGFEEIFGEEALIEDDFSDEIN